jgi:integrase
MPIPPRLLARLRRWRDKKLIARHFVELIGAALSSVKTGFKYASQLAELPGKVPPHTLRHTAETGLMQRGDVMDRGAPGMHTSDTISYGVVARREITL